MPTKRDAMLIAAVDVAREAAEGIAEPGTVGEHLEVVMDGERARDPLLRLPRRRPTAAGVGRSPSPGAARQKVATVCETNLCRATASVLSPQWLPYDERLAPGDLRAGDILPFSGTTRGSCGLRGDRRRGRRPDGVVGARPGSPAGAVRGGPRGRGPTLVCRAHGPTADVAEQAHDRCSTCGYFFPMAGRCARFSAYAPTAGPRPTARSSALTTAAGRTARSTSRRRTAAAHGSPILDEFAVDMVTERPGPAQARREPGSEPSVATSARSSAQPTWHSAVDGADTRAWISRR